MRLVTGRTYIGLQLGQSHSAPKRCRYFPSLLYSPGTEHSATAEVCAQQGVENSVHCCVLPSVQNLSQRISFNILGWLVCVCIITAHPCTVNPFQQKSAKKSGRRGEGLGAGRLDGKMLSLFNRAVGRGYIRWAQCIRKFVAPCFLAENDIVEYTARHVMRAVPDRSLWNMLNNWGMQNQKGLLL